MKTILALHTGLFPDTATVAAALAALAGQAEIRRLDLTRPQMDDAAWDAAAKAILESEVVIAT